MPDPPIDAVGDDSQSVRIRPEAAILPGRRDALTLTITWLLRKSIYWLGGLAMVLAAIGHQRDVSFGFDSPAAVVALIGVVLRFGSRFVGLALAYPLTVAYESELEQRSGFGSSLGKWLDRRQLAKSFRELRWTHHIRQVALERLGHTGDRLRRVESIIDVANIALTVSGLIAVSIAGAGAT
jgi:hypothetical protein